jgi:hypothetical protein
VRKALAHVRLVVKRLIRVQYGPYRLADLPNGAVLEVKPKKLDEKKKTTAKPTAALKRLVEKANSLLSSIACILTVLCSSLCDVRR